MAHDKDIQAKIKENTIKRRNGKRDKIWISTNSQNI